MLKVLLIAVLVLALATPTVLADPPSLPPTPLSSAPQNLTLQAGPGEVNLTWQPPPNATAGTTYRIYVNGARAGTTLGLHFTLPVPGWASLYYVTAMTPMGESAPSSPVFASYGGELKGPCNGGVVAVGGIVSGILQGAGLCTRLPPSFCEPIGIRTYSSYPFVDVVTHAECTSFFVFR